MGVETAILGSAALGAGSSFLGAQDAKKQNKKAQNNAIKASNAALAASMQPLAEQEAYTRKSADALVGGFDDAEAALQRTSALGQRDIGDAKVRAQANTAQRLTDRGLGGTTIGEQATQGVGRAYTRDMADFSSRMGQLRASLAQQRAQAKSQAYGQLAQFQAYKRDALTDPLNQQASMYANRSYTSQPVDLGGLGMLAALYGGKGGGGSGGVPGGPFTGGGVTAPSGYNLSQYGAFS